MTTPMATGFTCAGCKQEFEWTSELPLVGLYQIKTVGSRYCVDCIDKEAAAHGLSRERVIEMRRRIGQKIR